MRKVLRQYASRHRTIGCRREGGQGGRDAACVLTPCLRRSIVDLSL